MDNKSKAGWALGLIIAGCFIPVLGLIMVIVGLVFGHQVRNRDKNNNIALAALVIGYVYIVLFIVGLGFLFVGVHIWLDSYQNSISEKVEESSSTKEIPITVERLEKDSIYIQNVQEKQANISSISIEGETCNSDSKLIPSGKVNEVLCDNNASIGDTVNVAIRTDNGIYSASEIVR